MGRGRTCTRGALVRKTRRVDEGEGETEEEKQRERKEKRKREREWKMGPINRRKVEIGPAPKFHERKIPTTSKKRT